jgi:hypothetical protein
MRSRPAFFGVAIAGVLALGGLVAGPAVAAGHGSAKYGYTAGSKPDCADPHPLCVEVANPRSVFGSNKYVGHDEPSLLFYSNQPGSGNQMQYTMTLPKEPPATPAVGRSYSCQLSPASWVGMAMCDTFSYPLLRKDCTPDSDSNITSQDKHAGVAFMELQFYPPGWVQQFNGPSCTATQWCTALNVDSLSQQPTTGKSLNTSCQSKTLGGVEYINFAYLTHDGRPQGPPDPLHFKFNDSGKPNPGKVLLMNGGDTISVTLHDTPDGLQTTVNDLTNGQSGTMTASAANGFGHMVFAPEGDSCKVVPYNFHPMYSTTSPKTTVTWAAHTYNIAFSGEIGHFDWCSRVEVASFNCIGKEGPPGIDQEPADVDDRTPFLSACFPDTAALLFKVSGCEGTNAPGFDGAGYQPDWPDGNTNLHPTAMYVSSPHTGAGYNVPYSQAAFEIDTPRIERDDLGGTCKAFTGVGCTLLPPTDDGQTVAFYPFFTTNTGGGGCTWALGNDIPGVTTNDFGKTTQYGTLVSTPYLKPGGHGAIQPRIEVYHNTLANNPCP